MPLSLQTMQALSFQGYTASMVPPTTCSASRVCSMSASRGIFRVQRSELSSVFSSSEVSFSAIFCLTVQQHDTCRRRKEHDHNSQQRETVSCLREGLHLCGVITGVGAGVAAGSAAVWVQGRWGVSSRGVASSIIWIRRLSVRTHSASAFSRTNRQTFSSAFCTLNCTDSAISKPAGRHLRSGCRCTLWLRLTTR